MPFSLNDIKSFSTIDLDNFEIRGAKTGINNARSTGPLYDRGSFIPQKSVLYGSAVITSGDTTVTGISIPSVTAFDLVTGDALQIGSNGLSIDQIISGTSVTVNPAPTFSGSFSDATFALKDREYLIEPDVNNNTITGLAQFTSGSKDVSGSNTTWLTDLTSGDMIQLNTYQKYFIVDKVENDSSCVLTANFDDPSSPTGFNSYTAKRWRLDRLSYQYTKNYFTYDNQSAKWEYDTTSGSGFTAASDYTGFTDGIELKFSPTLKPESYPDLMDSNVALNKTLSRSTLYDAFEFPLPAVPIPEESFKLYINNVLKTKGVDYAINYSQLPVYVSPPPIEERTVANIMFLKDIQDSTLSGTQDGVLIFTDQSGNALQGVFPGSETITVDGTALVVNEDYVLDNNTGVGYASEVVTNEPVVKYVLYQQKNLYDLGIDVTLDGTSQQLTIPTDPSDDVLFDLESGTLKPMDQDSPSPGEEYIVTYYTEGDYITNAFLSISDVTNAVRVDTYPIKPQSVILSKNGMFLDENVDFRVSCLTGRLVFFSDLTSGDTLTISYAPLIQRINGLSYNNGNYYTTVYNSESSVYSLSPLSFNFSHTAIIDGYDLIVQKINNVTKSDTTYDITGYEISSSRINLISNAYNTSIGTESTDEIEITYKYLNDGLEYIPVVPINFTMTQDSSFVAFVDQSTNLFSNGKIVRLTNVDTAGDFYFCVSNSYYDGEDTVVVFTGTAPSDIINPTIFISDSSVILEPTNDVPSPIISGSTDIKITGSNISSNYRIGQLLAIGNDYYSIINSEYDASTSTNTISINVESFTDYTTTSVLSNIYRLDYPLYSEGTQTVSTKYGIIEEPNAPIMSLNFNGYAIITKDSSALSVDIGSSHYTFLDSIYPNSGSIETGLSSLGFNVNLYNSDWSSNKFVNFSEVTVTVDSSTLISGIPALRLDGTDTTSFSITGGILTIGNPIEIGQRYNFDYLGQIPLSGTVNFSGKTFSYLPAGSEIKVSMQYNNLDQFYIQVMDQRDFLEYIIQPAKQEEAIQQSGNVGQGGDIAGDEAGGNSQGGLTNDEFKRIDTSIECRVFNNIFDFFNGRLQAYTDEVYALKGLKFCNNDGPLSETDQSSGTLLINRMFPWSDYTNYSPYSIACLTGQSVPYVGPGTKKPNSKSPCKALFSGSAVTCTTDSIGFPTYWTKQLRVNDLIRPFDSTINHVVTSILNDTTLSISPPYAGSSTQSFVMTSKFPLFDDDGYTGPKIIGTKDGDFGLADGDVFDIQIDGIDQTYTFEDMPFPLSLLFPVSGLNAQDVARLLTEALAINVSVGWYFDPSSVYGYSTGLIARGDGISNNLIIKHGAAVEKLGFISDTTVYGNNDTSYAGPEYVYLNAELADINIQKSAISNSLGISNKLARPFNDATVIHDMALDELFQILAEMQLLNVELIALDTLLQEPSMPGFVQNLADKTTTLQFQADSSVALLYDFNIQNDYEGQNNPQKWLVNLQDRDTTIVYGIQNGYAVPYYSGVGVTNVIGQTVFSIQCESADDRRILDSTVDSTSFPIIIKYQDTSSVVDGTWYGFNSFGYSVNTDATFQINSMPLFYIRTDKTDLYYYIDSSGLGLQWDSTSHYLAYSDFTSVSQMKSDVSLIPGTDTTGDLINDSSNPRGLVITPLTQIIPDATIFDATIYSGLRECFVDYWTIDDKNLTDRSAFDNTRVSQLNSRLSYLDIRFNNIRDNMLIEEFLMSSDTSGIGNIYEWADNRFNRSVGCEARLMQIEKQIQVNQSGLTISKRFL